MGHLWDKWDMNSIALGKGQNGDNGDISTHIQHKPAKQDIGPQ
jgi:hypothetical protein